MVDSSELARELTPVLQSLGLELYDVDVARAGRVATVRVLIDRDGGVDLDVVTRATEAITPVLDHGPLADALPGSYALEVSSPGLERPLRRPEHYRRAVGSKVSVKVRAGQAPAQRLRGTLVGVGDDSCEIALDDGGVARVAFDEIVQARTVFEWGTPPRPGRRTKTAKTAGKTTAKTTKAASGGRAETAAPMVKEAARR
jgi:ribosome maturation factor RimP